MGGPFPGIDDLVYPRSARTAFDVGDEPADDGGELSQWQKTADVDYDCEEAIVIRGKLCL
jgi:hypothetical protein